MSWIARLRNLIRSEKHGRDLDRELDFHIAEGTDALMAQGLTRADAERQARIRFGHRQGVKEETRGVGILSWLDIVWNDLRYAARGLLGSPGFTLTVVLSLALGIGANTAIFSLLNAVLLKSLPVADPQSLLHVTMGQDHSDDFTNPIWEEVRRRQDVFSGAFAFSSESFNLAESGEVRRVAGNYIGGDFFPTLGVIPAAGRLLTGEDDYRGCPATAVLGYGFWQSEFGGDPGAIGRSLPLNGHRFTIVGVAPAGFFGVQVGATVQVYAPLCSEAILQGANSTLDGRSTWFLQVMGRPRPGLSLAQVNGRLAAIAPGIFTSTVPPGWDAGNVDFYLKNSLAAEPATTGLSDLRLQYRPALLILMGVVGIVLLIACGNVANLLLARGTVRQREIAMRLALGASRRRLIGQLLTESLLLSFLGSAAGFLFARWGSQLLLRLLGSGRSGVSLDLSLDYRLLGFTVAVAVLTGMLFGLVPAWRATRVDPQIAMRAHGRGVLHGGSGRLTLGKALVLAQVALSLVLVLGAALLLSTFHTLATLDPGFSRDGVIAVQMDLRSSGHSDAERITIQQEILERLRSLAPVHAAATAEILPVGGAGWNGGIAVPGISTRETMRDRVSWFNRVSADFFTTIGTTLKIGRDFGPGDVVGSVPVAIINESMARKYFPGVNPVGRQFLTETGPGDPVPYEVIGIVQDSKYRSLREDDAPIVYLPDRQTNEAPRQVYFLLHTDAPTSAIVPEVRQLIAAVDPRATFSAFSISRTLDRSLARERLMATLSGFFGGLAMLLALIGLYGIMSYSVARRRNEIGIRLALGAERSGVMRLVLGEVGRLVIPGVVLGVAVSLVAGRLVATFLYGVSSTDPDIIAITAGVVIIVALLAGAIPALRAARLDPVAALRED